MSHVRQFEIAPRAARRRRLPLLGRPVWALVALALVLRLGVVAASVDVPLTLDPADFSRTALSIADGHGYPPTNRAPGLGPSAFRPPAYPVAVAAVYALVGQEAPPAARALGAVLGTIAACLAGLIAARIWGRRAGVATLAVAAVAPPMVVLSTALVSETLFVPLVLAAVAAALESPRSRHPLRWALCAGLLVGLAELTRTNAAVLALPLGFAVWRTPRLRLRALAAPATLVAAALATVAPWTIRNALVMHAFVPVSTEVGYTLAGTYDAASRADTHWPAVWKEAEHGASPEYAPIIFAASIHRWGEQTLGAHLEAAALADIRRDPTYVLEVGFWNTLRLFHFGELDYAVANMRDTGIPAAPALLEIFGFYPLVALALLGIALGAARAAPKWLWLVPVCLASTVFVTSFIRFRSPIDPFLAMLAGVALAHLSASRRPAVKRSSDRRQQEGATAVSVPEA